MGRDENERMTRTRPVAIRSLHGERGVQSFRWLFEVPDHITLPKAGDERVSLYDDTRAQTVKLLANLPGGYGKPWACVAIAKVKGVWRVGNIRHDGLLSEMIPELGWQEADIILVFIPYTQDASILALMLEPLDGGGVTPSFYNIYVCRHPDVESLY